MPFKRASSGGRPSASHPQPEQEGEEVQQFVNVEARRKFELEIKERNIHQEKCFILKSERNFGLPTEISSVITVHKWRKFVDHPHNPIIPLVRELYSNILTGNQTFSMVRGIKVSFFCFLNQYAFWFGGHC